MKKVTNSPKVKEEKQEMDFPVYRDYFYTCGENLSGTDKPDEYNPDGNHPYHEYKSIYPFINADVEEISACYPITTDIGAKARALSFQINTDRFIHILADSIASLYTSIKGTIEYFWNVEYDNCVADVLHPSILSELYESVVSIMRSTNPVDAKAILWIAVDKFVSELYNDTHARISQVCTANCATDRDKANMLNYVYPIFVQYRDSLIDSLMRYIVQTLDMRAYADYIDNDESEDDDE